MRLASKPFNWQSNGKYYLAQMASKPGLNESPCGKPQGIIKMNCCGQLLKNSDEPLARVTQLNQVEKTKIVVKQGWAGKAYLRKSHTNGLAFSGELDKIMKQNTSTFFEKSLPNKYWRGSQHKSSVVWTSVD